MKTIGPRSGLITSMEKLARRMAFKIAVRCSLTDKCCSYEVDCEWLVNQFAKALDSENRIRMEIRSRLGRGDEIGFFSRLDEMYRKSRFCNCLKYGMLKNTASEHSHHSEHLPFKGPTNKDAVKEAISETVRNCELFVMTLSLKDSKRVRVNPVQI